MINRDATSISRLAVIFAILFTVIACGGGGGGANFYEKEEDNNEPDESVSLDALTSTTEGVLYSSLVTASHSDATNSTGSIVVANRAQTDLDGVLVTPRETVISLENVARPKVRSTSFIDERGYLIRTETITETATITCKASSEAKLPESVNIGDSGVLSTLSCDNKTIQTSNWKVDEAGEGSIAVVITTTTIDENNVITSTENSTFTLDSDGNIISFKSVTIQSSTQATLTIQSI